MNMVLKVVAQAVVALMVAAGLTLVSAPVAHTAGTTVVQGAYAHNCPYPSSSQCAARYYFKSSAPATMRCWTDAEYYTGKYGSRRWFIVDVYGTGMWIHSSYVTNQTVVTHC